MSKSFIEIKRDEAIKARWQRYVISYRSKRVNRALLPLVGLCLALCLAFTVGAVAKRHGLTSSQVETNQTKGVVR